MLILILIGGGRDFGGRGGGRGGPAGRGPNTHMGFSREIISIINSPEMSDANIHRSLFPPRTQNRSDYVTGVNADKNVRLPQLTNSNWRYETQVGAVIPFYSQSDDKPSVIANHFRYLSLSLSLSLS